MSFVAHPHLYTMQYFTCNLPEVPYFSQCLVCRLHVQASAPPTASASIPETTTAATPAAKGFSALAAGGNPFVALTSKPFGHAQGGFGGLGAGGGFGAFAAAGNAFGGITGGAGEGTGVLEGLFTQKCVSAPQQVPGCCCADWLALRALVLSNCVSASVALSSLASFLVVSLLSMQQQSAYHPPPKNMTSVSQSTGLWQHGFQGGIGAQ